MNYMVTKVNTLIKFTHFYQLYHSIKFKVNFYFPSPALPLSLIALVRVTSDRTGVKGVAGRILTFAAIRPTQRALAAYMHIRKTWIISYGHSNSHL